MRTLILAGLTMVTAIGATPALAQQMPPTGGPPMQHGPMPHGPMQPMQPMQHPPMASGMGEHHSRWGGAVGGHWAGGARAPGGWSAYRRPNRGWTLPRYWISPGFYINDYSAYGLASPPSGYGWTRYYDDAVLADTQGRVWDSVSGIDWDRDIGEGLGNYGDHGHHDHDRGYDDRDDGAGYGAPYPMPGRHELPRSLRELREPYAPPRHGYAPPPVPYGAYGAPRVIAGPNGSTIVTTSTAGYAAGGYWYPSVTTTTVTVQTQPVVTTTTSYIVERSRRVYRAPVHKWHRPRCGCK